MSERGLFITMEGVEGAGKSTAMDLVASLLKDADIDVVCTREPGGTVLGEKLRGLLLGTSEEAVDPMAELLMMFAARAQHLEQVILPSIKAGCWVLCDRFTDASFAYQGAGRKLGEEPVAVLEELVQGELRPDLTVLLDVPTEIGLERARGRGALDRFEQEDIAFFERVRRNYLRRAASGSGRYHVIDASHDLPTVQAALREFVSALTAFPPHLSA